MSNSPDPMEKLNQLHAWLLENKVGSPSRQPRVNDAIKITGPQFKMQPIEAAREIADFERWVNEIQSPARPPVHDRIFG